MIKYILYTYFVPNSMYCSMYVTTASEYLELLANVGTLKWQEGKRKQTLTVRVLYRMINIRCIAMYKNVFY